MTFTFHRRFTLAVRLVLMAVALNLAQQSCVGSLPSSRPVCGNCEEPNRFVRLERVTSDISPDIQPPFSHPGGLGPEEWTKILASIYVQKIKPGFLIMPGGKEREEPAFTPEEIRYFSMTLPKAFDRAQPDEIIVYALGGSPDSTISKFSTGGMFFQHEQLHVMLSNHRFAVTMPGIRELLWDHPLYSQAALYDLVPRPDQKILKQDKAAIHAAPLTLAIAYKNLLLGPSNFPNSAPNVPSIEHHQPTELSVEDRLETLKHLRERGLITEEEFQTKKRELLDLL